MLLSCIHIRPGSASPNIIPIHLRVRPFGATTAVFLGDLCSHGRCVRKCGRVSASCWSLLTFLDSETFQSVSISSPRRCVSAAGRRRSGGGLIRVNGVERYCSATGQMTCGQNSQMVRCLTHTVGWTEPAAAPAELNTKTNGTKWRKRAGRVCD